MPIETDNKYSYSDGTNYATLVVMMIILLSILLLLIRPCWTSTTTYEHESPEGRREFR